MRLHFPNPQIRRLVEGSGSLEGMEGDAVDRFFEVIAVVGAARSVDDLIALRPFAPTRLDGPAGRRWGIPMGLDWQLVVTIDDGPPRTISLEEIRSGRHSRRAK